ncbi:MAG TPA: peptidylprolyl isomerase [Acidimicrobiales bacterium]|nr:peptidylprolyl isomerase [Acidimicrobiales bacterium]
MKRGFASCLAALVLVGTACSTLTPWAAKVNGEMIATSDLDRELEAILSNKRYLEQVESANLTGGVKGSGQGTFTTAFVGRILTRQIFFELIEQEVARRKLKLSGADEQAAAADVVASFGEEAVYKAFPEQYRRDLVLRQAQVTALQEDIAEVEVDDAAVEKFFKENSELFARTCVSHILVATPEEAVAAKARIDGGEDFAAVASETSIDPGSGANGGELGCVPSGSFVPEFESVMETLPIGQVSAPTQTQFGSHLILVTGRTTQPIDEVRAEIRQRLLSEGQAGFDAFVDAALDKATIEVNPRYGRFDPDAAQPGIIPPQGPTPDADEVPEELPEGVGPPPLQPQG